MKFKVVLFFSSPIAGDVECLRSTYETFMFPYGELICSFYKPNYYLIVLVFWYLILVVLYVYLPICSTVGEDFLSFCRLSENFLCVQKLSNFIGFHLLILGALSCAGGVLFRRFSPGAMT